MAVNLFQGVFMNFAISLSDAARKKLGELSFHVTFGLVCVLALMSLIVNAEFIALGWGKTIGIGPDALQILFIAGTIVMMVLGQVLRWIDQSEDADLAYFFILGSTPVLLIVFTCFLAICWVVASVNEYLIPALKEWWDARRGRHMCFC